MGFSRQEYWSGLPFPTPADLPDPGMEPMSPALPERFFIAEPPGKPDKIIYCGEACGVFLTAFACLFTSSFPFLQEEKGWNFPHGAFTENMVQKEVFYIPRTLTKSGELKHTEHVLGPQLVFELRWQGLDEKGMVTHSSILSWRIPWTRSLADCSPWERVGYDLATKQPQQCGWQCSLGSKSERLLILW